MTVAKKKADADAPVEDAEADKSAAKNDHAPAEPVKTTEVTWNGLTAHDTIDGVAQAPRTATLAEQLPVISQELLSLVVGSVPYAASGSISVDGTTLTITLVSH